MTIFESTTQTLSFYHCG